MGIVHRKYRISPINIGERSVPADVEVLINYDFKHKDIKRINISCSEIGFSEIIFVRPFLKPIVGGAVDLAWNEPTVAVHLIQPANGMKQWHLEMAQKYLGVVSGIYAEVHSAWDASGPPEALFPYLETNLEDIVDKVRGE